MDKTFLHRILPEYVLENQDKFVDFIEHWLDFNEQNIDIKSILNNFDIDTVHEKELDNIKTLLSGNIELLENTENTLLPQDRLILKNIKDIFDSKGSEEALSYIFKYYYKEHIKVNCPKNKTLICSSGHWSKPIIFTVDKQCGMNSSLIGRNVRGLQSLSTGLITSLKENNNVCYIGVGKIDGTFISGEIIEVIK
jgi:hypothetical protein